MGAEPFPPERWLRRIFPWAGLPPFERNVAVHEAAHAVVADEIGIPTLGIEVTAKGGECFLGYRSIHEAKVVQVAPERVWLIAAKLAALYESGIQAELLNAGVPLGDCVVRTNESDQRMALMILHEITRSTAALGWAQRYARAVLTRRWAEIELLAERLRNEGALRW